MKQIGQYRIQPKHQSTSSLWMAKPSWLSDKPDFLNSHGPAANSIKIWKPGGVHSLLSSLVIKSRNVSFKTTLVRKILFGEFWDHRTNSFFTNLKTKFSTRIFYKPSGFFWWYFYKINLSLTYTNFYTPNVIQVIFY